jgi:hypothetical protein
LEWFNANKGEKMTGPTKFGKAVRIAGIILVGLTAVFHLMGGIGTTCVALGAENYDSMVGIVPFKWLYQIFVVVTIGIAVFGFRSTVQFAKNKDSAYKNAVIVLVVGVVVTGIHVIASQILRGKSMPNDIRLYLNILTLIVFLLFRISRLRNAMGMDGGPGKGGASELGATFILMGIAALTVQIWAGPTHTFNDINYADIWRNELMAFGWILVIIGIPIIYGAIFKDQKIDVKEKAAIQQL